MKLKGKNALITGAGRGIGRAIAYALAQEGANLSIISRTKKELNDARQELQKQNVRVLAYTGDISKLSNTRAWIKKSALQFGRIDILVNNAGIYGPIGPLEQTDMAQWKEAIEVNLMGTVYATREVLPLMIKQKAGNIVNLSGGGALYPSPRFSAYSASKAAVVRFTETMAEEAREHNIRINAISPGSVNTKFLDVALAAGKACGKEHYDKSIEQKKSGGVAPQKAAELAVFLCSKDSYPLTGKVISAIWDNWKNIPERMQEFERTALYTMRRIDEHFFIPVKNK